MVAYVSIVSSPYVSLVSGMNKPFYVAVIGVIVCGTNIILNYLIIPENGILSSFGISGPLGASYTTIISTTFAFIGFLYIARRLAGTNIYHNYIAKHIFAGFVTFISLVYFSGFIMIFRWYHLFIFFAIDLVVYVAVLYILGEFTKNDFDFFVDLMHPKKMLEYAISEIKE